MVGVAPPYLGVSDYLEVPAGARNLKVNAAGSAPTLPHARARVVRQRTERRLDGEL